jgi:hypothetical protein
MRHTFGKTFLRLNCTDIKKKLYQTLNHYGDNATKTCGLPVVARTVLMHFPCTAQVRP